MEMAPLGSLPDVLPEPAALLAWYDRHARSLPWRVGPGARAAGVRPDPYRVWLSEIMLQQTTVAAAGPYFEAFVTRWPRVTDLAAAEDGAVMAAWAGLGYYARARNLLRAARDVAAAGGRFPETEDALRELPGVGRYTAAAVAAIAFDRPATVVDGNVERVMSRLFAVETPLPASKPRLYALAEHLTPALRPGDYAQAVMDLGATLCTPTSPACGICPWQGPCRARQLGLAAALPKKAPKPAKPLRRGMVFFLRRAGDRAVWLERRPDKGLLGGTLCLPGPAWEESPAEAPLDTLPDTLPDPLPDPLPGAPLDLPAAWRTLPAAVRHTFTHFHLTLDIAVAEVGEVGQASLPKAPPTARFHPPDETGAADLPTVMRKAFRLGHAALDTQKP